MEQDQERKPMARRLRQVVDLYVTGKVATLRDGSPVWVQALNPFEQDTARNEAQIAKARITLAIKEFGSDEQTKVRMFFFEEGTDGAKLKLVDAKVAESMPRILDSIRNDPEWAERIQILERGLDDTAKPVEGVERELVEKVSTEYTTEIGERLSSEREYLVDKFISLDEESLWQEYLDWYLDRRAAEMMLAEYRLHQMLFGVRWCNGVESDGQWDHAECDGHQSRMFSDKAQVQSAPEELIAVLMDTAEQVEISVRDAKNSRRQGSSSDSSPLPSEEEASTASIPREIRAEHPGTSSSPSATPSPSSASTS
jgi:hypothetical protein